MVENFSNYNRESILPTEILLNIFAFLPAKQVIQCREVCVRWKQIIDRLTRSDHLWKTHCKYDFHDIHLIAKLKSPNLTWFNIYTSLSLWSKLDEARVHQHEFCKASNLTEEIKHMEILQSGVVGVHKKAAIVYYDANTLEKTEKETILGEFLRYTENAYTIVMLNFHLQLCVKRKLEDTFKQVVNVTKVEDTFKQVNVTKLEDTFKQVNVTKVEDTFKQANVTFENVKMYIAVEKEVYYVNLDDEIYVCKVDESTLCSKFLSVTEDGVMSLSYSNGYLNVLTFQRKIYSVINQELVFVSSLGVPANLMHELREYNFLERMDWRIYFQWMYMLNRSFPEAPLRDIVTVRTYGDMVFVGSNWGVLRIYYSPKSSGEFDLCTAKPVKEYNFMNQYDHSILPTMCPIIQFDVSETKCGHTVFVAMPKKIVVLKFIHDF